MNTTLHTEVGTILEYSIYEYSANFGNLRFGKGELSVNKKLDDSDETISKFFMLSKHKTVEENILFSAKQLFNLISEKPKHIDELLMEYSNENSITLNLNIERIAYLALTFLYSMDEIKMNGNMIVKSKGDEENDI